MRKNICSLTIWILSAIINIHVASSQVQNYVFPTYNELARRTRTQGTVQVEVTAINGNVNNIEVLSCQLRSPTTPNINRVPEFMAKDIIDPLSKWDFYEEEIKFQLTIVYRLIQTKDDEKLYTSSIREKNGMPVEIIVEAEAPTIVGEPGIMPGPSPKKGK